MAHSRAGRALRVRGAGAVHLALPHTGAERGRLAGEPGDADDAPRARAGNARAHPRPRGQGAGRVPPQQVHTVQPGGVPAARRGVEHGGGGERGDRLARGEDQCAAPGVARAHRAPSAHRERRAARRVARHRRGGVRPVLRAVARVPGLRRPHRGRADVSLRAARRPRARLHRQGRPGGLRARPRVLLREGDEGAGRRRGLLQPLPRRAPDRASWRPPATATWSRPTDSTCT